MDVNSKVLRCPCCGASIPLKGRECEYCGSSITICYQTPANKIDPIKLKKYIISYEKIQLQFDGKNETLGISYLYLKQFAKAIDVFDKAICETPNNANLYLLKSIALLAGKTPFATPLAVIKEIINNIQTAILLEEKAIYHYFVAYIKYDFYNRKFLRIIPTCVEELQTAMALGLTKDDIECLEKHLQYKIIF